MSELYEYDLIVIGAGSGGVRAGRIAASHGAKVAVIEGDRPGGTCVIRGCVPKKLLVYGSTFAIDAEDAAGFGWQIEGLTHSWSALIAAKDKEIARLEGAYRNLLKQAGAELIEGFGEITGPHHVSVAGRVISGAKILIAVGGKPHFVDLPGLAEHAISSNEALDLPERPAKIVIYGAGYIALEFACIFNALGSEVHLVYRGDLPLRGFDMDVRRHIKTALSNRNITIHNGKNVTSVAPHNDGYKVTLDDESSLIVDKVMAATGRLPNIDRLGLDEQGVATNSKGAVIVNEYSQTSIPSIYAVGDVTDRINLTPMALAEGHAFADTEFGNKRRVVNHELVPSAVFSQPSIASVGLNEEQAAASYGELDVYESQFEAMKNSLSGRKEQTYMKLIIDRASQKVLGVHLIDPDSAEIMQGIAIAVKMGATKADFDAVIGIHPSTAEEFVTMRTARAPA